MHSFAGRMHFVSQYNAFCDPAWSILQANECILLGQRMGYLPSMNGGCWLKEWTLQVALPPPLLADMVWNVNSKTPFFALQPTAVWDQTRHASAVSPAVLARIKRETSAGSLSFSSMRHRLEPVHRSL
jgi:hypothetical protein